MNKSTESEKDWLVLYSNEEDPWTHIIPVNDDRSHTEDIYCPCQPRIDWDSWIIIHNSFDFRELVE